VLRLTEARSGAGVCDPQHLRNVSKPDTHGSRFNVPAQNRAGGAGGRIVRAPPSSATTGRPSRSWKAPPTRSLERPYVFSVFASFSLSPRGTSGGRVGEGGARGSLGDAPPLPDPLLPAGEEREKRQRQKAKHIRKAALRSTRSVSRRVSLRQAPVRQIHLQPWHLATKIVSENQKPCRQDLQIPVLPWARRCGRKHFVTRCSLVAYILPEDGSSCPWHKIG